MTPLVRVLLLSTVTAALVACGKEELRGIGASGDASVGGASGSSGISGSGGMAGSSVAGAGGTSGGAPGSSGGQGGSPVGSAGSSVAGAGGTSGGAPGCLGGQGGAQVGSAGSSVAGTGGTSAGGSTSGGQGGSGDVYTLMEGVYRPTTKGVTEDTCMTALAPNIYGKLMSTFVFGNPLVTLKWTSPTTLSLGGIGGGQASPQECTAGMGGAFACDTPYTLQALYSMVESVSAHTAGGAATVTSPTTFDYVQVFHVGCGSGCDACGPCDMTLHRTFELVPQPPCAPFTACGGDLTGSWHPATACSISTGEYGCPTKVKTATVSSYTQGSVTLEPGGLYYASEWTAGTSQGEWDTPKVCLPSGADCMTIGGVDAGDHCMVSFSPDAQSIHVSPGTPYSVAGSSVTFYGDSSGLWGSRTFDFCVSGNTLRLRAQSVNGATLFDEVTVFGK